MIVPLLIAAVVLVGLLAVAASRLRGDPLADVHRFRSASELTSSWSHAYEGVAEPEQPEAYTDKPELQQSVHPVEP